MTATQYAKLSLLLAAVGFVLSMVAAVLALVAL